MNYWIESDFIPNFYFLYHSKYKETSTGNILIRKSPTLCEAFTDLATYQVYENHLIFNQISINMTKKILHIGDQDIPLESIEFKTYQDKYNFPMPL
jgi:hypothetical protein